MIFGGGPKRGGQHKPVDPQTPQDSPDSLHYRKLARIVSWGLVNLLSLEVGIKLWTRYFEGGFIDVRNTYILIQTLDSLL